LRVCPGGGAPFPISVHKAWKEATGLAIHEGYGMTEIAPISVNTAKAGVKLGTVGKPVPDTIIQIVDLEKGENILSPDEMGEIRIKGPHMMTGYSGNSEETDFALRNGYIYTGDIGLIDTEGFLRITDRKKDVIFVKGFNVFPREVEEELLNHGSITGACVIGRLDERSGEVPIAFFYIKKYY
jgi:long-chain acyl-CoA synthetase